MELALLVYSISLLEGLRTFLVVAGFAAVMGTVVSGALTLEAYDDTTKTKLWFKRSIIALAVVGFTGVLVPSERTAYIMVAAYATQKVAETPEVKETGDKVLTLINSKLDQLILEASEPKKGKKHD